MKHDNKQPVPKSKQTSPRANCDTSEQGTEERMKKRNRITNVLGLGSLPMSQPTVKEPNWETPRQLSQRLRREQQEELAKKQQAIEDADPTRQAERAYVDAMTKVAIEFRERLKKLYRDVETVKDYIKHDIEALIDDLGLPTQNPLVTMNEFETRMQVFVDGLPKGVTFNSDAAKEKFNLYCWVASRQGTVIDNSTLQTMLERCESLSVGVTLPRANKQSVKPEPTFDELLSSTSGDTRAGKELLEKATQAEAFVEAAPLYHEWLSHLYSDFGGFIPTEADKKYILDVLFPRNNWAYTSVNSYHMARRAMCAQGRWDSTRLLLPDEKLAREVENIPLNDYHQRRELVQRVRDSRG
jgi:hypothetical protein